MPNSYRSISVWNSLGKVYKKVIQQEAINVLTGNNFFEGKNVFAYQKNKNSSQALLPLIEQISDAISSEKYGIAVIADLGGAFDTLSGPPFLPLFSLAERKSSGPVGLATIGAKL